MIKRSKLSLFIFLTLILSYIPFGLSYSTAKAASTENPDTGYNVGQFAADFSTIDTDGKSFQLSEMRDKKPVYLIFWATWCKTCKHEMPTFIDLYERHNSDLEIVSINVDSLSFWSSLKKSNQRVKEYVDQYQIPYRVILDDEEKLIKQFNVQGTPTQLLIDKEGVIRKRYPLFTEKTERLIEKVVAENSSNQF